LETLLFYKYNRYIGIASVIQIRLYRVVSLYRATLHRFTFTCRCQFAVLIFFAGGVIINGRVVFYFVVLLRL